MEGKKNYKICKKTCKISCFCIKILIGWDMEAGLKIASIPGPYITPASYRACFLNLLAYISRT